MTAALRDKADVRAPLDPIRRNNRRIVRQASILVALLSVPVAGLALLQAGVWSSCETASMAVGTLEGKIEWRITRMICRGVSTPFYDVAIGAERMTLSTALTTRGAPAPIAVERTSDGVIAVRLDGPRRRTGEMSVPLKMRRSGAPAERIDLQADETPLRR